MALEKQTVAIPFAQGIDTKTDPKQVKLGKFVSLLNGIYTTLEKIKKRFGYTSLSQDILGGGTISKGVAVKSFQNETNLIDGKQFYSYSPNKSSWKNVGNYVPTTVDTVEITSSITNVRFADMANNGTYTCYAYIDDAISAATASATPLFLQISDSTSGSIVYSVRAAASARYCKVWANGTTFVCVYFNPVSNKLQFVGVNTTAITTLVGPTDIAADINPTMFLFDGVVAGGFLHVGYNVSGGNVGFYTINTSFVVANHTVLAGTNANLAIALWTDPSNNIWVAVANGALVQYAVYTTHFASVVLALTTADGSPSAAFVLNITGVWSFGIASELYYSANVSGSNGTQGDIANIRVDSSGGIGSVSSVVGYVQLYAKAFQLNNQVFLPCVAYSGVQPSLFLLRADALTVAKVLPLDTILWYTYTVNSRIPLINVNLLDANTVQYATVRLSTLGAFAGSILDSSALCSTTITLNTTPVEADVGGILLLSGGVPSMYDGANIVEQGFNNYPETPTLTPTVGGGPLSAGLYSFVIVYEWVDARGNVYQSNPSRPVTYAAAAGDKVTITAPTLRLTQKSAVVIDVYSTTANGTVYYRATDIPRISSNYNDTTVSSINIALTPTDAQLIGGDVLYTGSEVENISPPAARSVASYRNRAILIPSELGNDFWYSKDITPNVGIEFSDIFTQSVDQRGGFLMAAEAMDDKLIILKRNLLFYMTGSGPAASGASNDFSAPLLINSDVGCNNPVSIVLSPVGMMFQSDKGIYLLDRSLNATYIGADVESYVKGSMVTSAKLMEDVNQIRFTLNNGFAVVYDYLVQQWDVFSDISAVDATIVNKVYTYVTAAGLVAAENSSGFSDGGTFYPLTFKTNWISLAGLQGYQRIYKLLLLGDYLGSHQLKVEIAYDFDSTIKQTDLINATAIAPTVYQWRVFPNRQKCESIQFTISDVQSSSFNEGFSLSNMALEIGVKKGLNKMPATQSFG